MGDGRQRISLTSVDNLVRACLLAAAGPVECGVFNVTDAEPVILDDALRAILRERGIDAEPSYLPLNLVAPLAAVAEIAFRLLGRPRPPRLTRYAAGHLAVERTLDITAARDRLRYRPTATSFAGAARLVIAESGHGIGGAGSVVPGFLRGRETAPDGTGDPEIGDARPSRAGTRREAVPGREPET